MAFKVKYPCVLRKGYIVRTKDERDREFDHADGKYVYFKDGSQYGFNHPDLVGAEVRIPSRKKAEDKE